MPLLILLLFVLMLASWARLIATENPMYGITSLCFAGLIAKLSLNLVGVPV